MARIPRRIQAGGQARAKLARDLHGFVIRQPANAAQQAGKILAVDIFHRDEGRTIHLADVVHAADVGVRDLARNAHFAVEAFERMRVKRTAFVQELQGHWLVELEVSSAIDFPHAAYAECAEDPVAFGEDDARCEASVFGCGGRGEGGGRDDGCYVFGL